MSEYVKEKIDPTKGFIGKVYRKNIIYHIYYGYHLARKRQDDTLSNNKIADDFIEEFSLKIARETLVRVWYDLSECAKTLHGI
jgi:hypothetical protein